LTDLAFSLTDADRLDTNDLISCGHEHRDGVPRRRGDASSMSPRAHAPNEDLLIGSMPLHANAISQDGPSSHWAGGVHGEHGHGPTRPSICRDKLIDDRAFASAWIARDADHEGRTFAVLRPQQRQGRHPFGFLVFD
jgi:hypothetical protein